jgi:trehalose utilization protein
VYPDGINGAIATALKSQAGVEVRTAKLDDADAGVSEAALNQTDVLIWFGHRRHDQVPDDAVQRIVRHVRDDGMGFLPVHSSHFSKPLKALLQVQNTPNVGAWLDYIDDGKPLKILVTAPDHPIIAGVHEFTIPKTERYDEPFQVPGPEATVFDGVYADGRHARQGLCWTIGKGRVFYWRPGHETYPIFFQPEVQQVIRNAVAWLAHRR